MTATWLPYELRPDTPREGVERPEYARPHGHLDAMAAETGLTLRRGSRLINSRLALSTAEFAREHGRFDEVHRALLKGHWEQTADLSSVDDLVRIAVAHGLDGDALRAALAAGTYESMLDEHRAEAESIGVSAIPAHIVGDTYLLVGAHPYETFIEVLEKLKAEPAAG